MAVTQTELVAAQSTGGLSGIKTYLAAGAIIVHQILMFFGIDVPSDLMSESIDGILAIAAVVFRWLAAVKTMKIVEVAKAEVLSAKQEVKSV